ncbi:Rpn family recombination-promoting nuclease/putative transposase [Sphingobacterium multivorum]|uniref:Rpn family recombination-promoting nuclease/putative transposase n=1 Tax=Sphingobacterium multivorum TaxID=28454 RepID=UPI003DA3DD08
MSPRRRRVDDPLWKSILEQTFSHFLRFIFPEADAVFDLSRPFDYLDKEFEQLFPPESNGKGVRYVDKLVKVFLRDGSEQFVLCHVEIQSNKGRGDLAERMFRYFYRIWDRYKVPITAIAILADENKGYHPMVYSQQFMGTSLRYDFNSYKILDQDELILRANENPFSVIVLTALLAIVNKKVTDEGLKEIKHDLYDEMMKREMDKGTRQGLYDFLTYYVSFDNEEVLSIFEEEIKTKIGRSDTMGTQEYLLDKAEKKGIQKGKIEGKIEGKREEAIAIAMEFKKMGLPIADIAKGTGLSIEEIEKL